MVLAGALTSESRLPVLFLMGPTATGKTELAVRLSESFPVELVSVDAAQVYRGMNIGTAKPEPALLVKYPHRLIDICEPTEPYSAARFRQDALRAIAEIHNAGHLPLLVGGTMFYFSVLEHGLSSLPAANQSLRLEIEKAAAERGWPALHQQLQAIDSKLAASIQPEDTQRIQRALEIHRLTGVAPSNLMKNDSGSALPYPLIKLSLFAADRRRLHTKIERRLRNMLDAGLLDEVRSLRERGDLSPKLPAIRTVGYRQAWEHLSGDYGCEEMAQGAIAATRQLAKRQLTWLRQQRGLVWIESGLSPESTAKAYFQEALAVAGVGDML